MSGEEKQEIKMAAKAAFEKKLRDEEAAQVVGPVIEFDKKVSVNRYTGPKGSSHRRILLCVGEKVIPEDSEKYARMHVKMSFFGIK